MIIIVDGVDRVGKDTQIKKIQEYFKDRKHFHVLKYSNVKGVYDKEGLEWSKRYYSQMFNIFYTLDAQIHYDIICNRAHLGEFVYSPMYRNYDGSYIFEIENWFKLFHKRTFEKIYLITFIDNAKNLISREDGLSLSDNIDNKNKEINLFIEAHKRSLIQHKLLININEKSIEEIAKTVQTFLEREMK